MAQQGAKDSVLDYDEALEAEIQRGYSKLKADHGGFAAIAWIACGIWHFAVLPQARFLSWQALLYFLVGMFVAAIVFGIPSYFAVRGLSKLFMRSAAMRASTLRRFGCLLSIVLAVIIFFASRWAIVAITR